MFFNLLCDAHPQQSPLFQIWHELPGIYKFGILAAAVVFFWAKVSRNTGEVKTGVGVTTLNAEEQMTNWAGTQQMNGETIVEIAQTDNGFESITRNDETGDETAWSVERQPE